jgi:transcriptional regulator
MSNQSIDRDLKKGSAELLILSLLERQQRHGYEICKLIETRSKGKVRFRVASLYPLLYRLEDRGLIQGKWVEKPGQRRRRFYKVTAAGRKMLVERREGWAAFVEAIRHITGAEYA